MKGKAIPKTEKNRTLAGLMMLLFCLMVAGAIAGCSQSSGLIPAELRGKYATDDPKYKNQFFELGPVLITLGFGGGKFKHYNVKRIEKEIIDYRTLYTILCTNEDEGEEFNFSFFVDFAGEGIIHFKNKPQVTWEKKKTRISESDFTRKVYLKKGDFLKNEAKQINAMTKALSNSIAIIKRENLLLTEDIEASIQGRGHQTEFAAKLKDFRDRANRCWVQLDNFQLIGDSTNNLAGGQRQQLVGENPLSAHKCL